MKKLIVILIFISFFLLNSFVLAASSPTLKDAFSEKGGLKDVANKSGFDQFSGSLEEKIGRVITTALSLLGVFFMILMIYGGFVWMSDRGNEDKVEKAKKIITAAIIGLIIVLTAYAISYFLVSALIK